MDEPTPFRARTRIAGQFGGFSPNGSMLLIPIETPGLDVVALLESADDPERRCYSWWETYVKIRRSA